MIRTLWRVLGGLVRIAFVVLLVSVLASAAVTTGLIDPGPEDGERIETPDPLPDWPFVWEVPVDDDSRLDPGPELDGGNASDAGDPVREDPGSTSFEHRGETISSDEIEVRIHERVNAIRADNNRSRLEHDDRIANVSRTYSHDMGTREFFSHVSPEGETPSDRLDGLFPHECRGVGENLAYVTIAGAGDADTIAERIVDGWMNSDSHRENLLAPRWDDQGIGVYIGDDRAFATQMFCDRR